MIAIEVLLNFFSTFAQSIAALVGLTGAFAIFFYQNRREMLLEKARHIHQQMEASAFYALKNEGHDKYHRLHTHLQRARYIEDKYLQSLAEADAQAESHFQKTSLNKLSNYASIEEEFKTLNFYHESMIAFRKKALRSTAVGLTLILLSLFAIPIAPAITVPDLHFAAVAIFLSLAAVYVWLVYGMLNISLETPE